jgi:hypothetical protein
VDLSAEVASPVEDEPPEEERDGLALPELAPEAAEPEAGEPLAAAAGRIGLLAGIQGALPAEPLFAQPQVEVRAPGTEQPQRPELLDSQAKLFAEIVAPPAELPLGDIAQPRARSLAPLARWIIYALLLAAVTLPLLLGDSLPSLLQGSLLPGVSFLVKRSVEATPAVTSLYQQIESLESGAPVLVAFDYDPATAGEMDALAQAILRHLADRQMRVVAVSLMPAGPATAQNLLRAEVADQPAYSEGYGQHYANLGYLPGGATAVRLLGQSLEVALPSDFFGNPVRNLGVLQGITSVGDFHLIVELAATQDTLRWWIEQAGTPYDVPLGAAVSAAMEPLARPYYLTASRQLVGLAGGVPGAAMYAGLLNDARPMTGVAARLAAQRAGHLVFILVLLVGNGVYLLRRATRPALSESEGAAEGEAEGEEG